MTKPIGDAIREARARKGISQADLAGILKVSQAAVGQWERGATAPRAKYVHLMADVFDDVFRSDIGFSKIEADIIEKMSSTAATSLRPSFLYDDALPHDEDREARILIAEHRAKAGEFDRLLVQALLRLDPTLRSHVAVGGEHVPNQWIADYMTQKSVIEVKHPSGYSGIESMTARALLQLTVLRALIGRGKNYVGIVRRPPLAPLPEHALPAYERKIEKLVAEANLVGLHLLFVDSAEEAAKAIGELEAQEPDDETT